MEEEASEGAGPREEEALASPHCSFARAFFGHHSIHFGHRLSQASARDATQGPLPSVSTELTARSVDKRQCSKWTRGHARAQASTA